MSKTSQPSRVQFLALHVIDTLPDSTTARRELLETLDGILPQGDPVRSKVRLMLRHMDAFDQEQTELPFAGKKDGGNGE